MSANSPPIAGGSSITAKKTIAQPTKAPSDWLGTSLLAAKLIASAAEAAPVPYVKAVFGSVVVLLETVEKVKKNREEMKELCEDTVEIIKIVQGQIKAHGDTAAVKFKGLCEDLERCLQDILNAIEPLKKEPRGFRSRFKEVVKWSSTADQIAGYQKRIQTLRSNFVLTATVDTNFQVHKLTTLGFNVAVPQVIQSINNCPPPSRIFHGRQIILNKMQAYFSQDIGKQHIFLLHGLGGAGKTQIALKFIQESSQFSDIFMLDASTTDTLDAALKNITVTKNVGDTPQDALKWLASKHHDWLLFFDNADDPKINLNSYFPQCSHGNIVITSRNPGLCVHAGLHSLVSDMEEVDAVELLLKSAAQETTLANMEIAAEIVKALWYLPLAIIQAGAFIAKSGALNSYLALYSQNRARLLSEKPAQSHDDYAWTVYTTWEISFKQLSQPAATLLQLCSFLHHQGILEKMFHNASTYKFKPTGPSKEELKKPLEFLSQFLGPTGVWDSLQFMDVTTELRAYSLINFDMNSGTFSIHPLVHSWSQSILADQQEYHHSMIAIVGMSTSTMTNDYLQLASLWLLPHVDALLQGGTQTTPDFNYEYGRIYYFSGRHQRAADLHTDLLMRQREILGKDHPDTLRTIVFLAVTYKELGQFKEAGELEVSVLEKQKITHGEDHQDTLHAMGNLALTYQNLGHFKGAEELEVVVLEKRREILGEDHPDTLHAMGNLALTYRGLGKLKEAEELEVVVLEKRREILGEDHPDTLHAMGNLSLTYRGLGKLKEAEEFEVVVFDKQREILGGDHPDTLRAMGSLASTYHDLGKLKEAEELGVVVLEKRREILGGDHPDTLGAMGNLGDTYRNLGKLKEAEELGVVVLEKQRQSRGEDHPDTLRTMGNLANTYYTLDKLKEAEELEVVVLEKRRQFLGEDHPDTLLTMGNLANTYYALDKLKEAEELGVVVLEKRREILGEDHHHTFVAMRGLQQTYERLGKSKEAKRLKVLIKRIEGRKR
ncbi:hypothetical protein DFH07DRAFT_359600 [Mycena maculata]|uniref:DUF7779 domain-containing protein n=1 Tax=Mycena maculata TaxID=230809 RepID=A0AAD7NKU3_9AGAR|nr:hypothetical protein DFH07DRAFT_359600 [Mycena maculata]